MKHHATQDVWGSKRSRRRWKDNIKKDFQQVGWRRGVHWSALSYGQVTAFCKHDGLVLRFRNKWSYRSTPYAIMAWKETNLPFLPPPQKQWVSIIKPDRLKTYYAEIRIELTNTFCAGKTERFRDVPPGGTQSMGNISVTIHQLRELKLPPQGEGELRSSGMIRSIDW